MLHYDTLKQKRREFLAATGLTAEEFLILQPAFQAADEKLHPNHQTRAGKPRRRGAGAGAKGALTGYPDQLLFILVYQKTNPLQTMHGLQFGLSQPQANHWIHRLLPILQQALADLQMKPEREAAKVAESLLAEAAKVAESLLAEAAKVAESLLASEGTLALVIDGTERRRQRPQEPEAQRAHYSGKKKAHTDKNLLLVNESTGKVAYLGPTEAGRKHDKKAADEAQIVSPVHATLGQDTGFQGYAPAGVLTQQPQKKAEGKKAKASH